MIRTATRGDLPAIRELLLEYERSLGVDLSFQDFHRELETLDTYYEVILIDVPQTLPSVAAQAGVPVPHGGIALRRVDEATCEMKRLYVRPSGRGKGLGRALAEALIAEAKRRGYRHMRLDTLPSMREAMGLYESLGFRDIEPYRFNPIAGTRFLELDLHGE